MDDISRFGADSVPESEKGDNDEDLLQINESRKLGSASI